MSNNIFDPTKSNFSPAIETRGSLPKWLIFGFLIAIVGNSLAGFIYGFSRAIYLSSNGKSSKDITAALEVKNIYTLDGLALVTLGTLISFYAAYICAKKAGVSAKISVILLGAASALFNLYVFLEKYSVGTTMLLVGLTIWINHFGYQKWLQRAAQLNHVANKA